MCLNLDIRFIRYFRKKIKWQMNGVDVASANIKHTHPHTLNQATNTCNQLQITQFLLICTLHVLSKIKNTISAFSYLSKWWKRQKCI